MAAGVTSTEWHLGARGVTVNRADYMGDHTGETYLTVHFRCRLDLGVACKLRPDEHMLNEGRTHDFEHIRETSLVFSF